MVVMGWRNENVDKQVLEVKSDHAVMTTRDLTM